MWKKCIASYSGYMDGKFPLERIVSTLNTVLNRFHFSAKQIEMVLKRPGHQEAKLLALSLDYLDCMHRWNEKDEIKKLFKTADMKFLPRIKEPFLTEQQMDAVVEDLIRFTHQKLERKEAVGPLTVPTEIFKPEELQLSPSEHKLDQMCWDLCEHFFLDDILVKEILNLSRAIKMKVLVAAINLPDKMYCNNKAMTVLNWITNHKKVAATFSNF
jgi:hypothetical protein